MVPSPEECFLLLKEHEVPENVVEHSRVVWKLAAHLCRLLNLRGERLDQGRVEAGALLHDIAKIKSMNTGKGHAQAGASLLDDLGFPEIAGIVRQHVVLDQEENDGITEAELVNYADKRVLHTAIVSLPERFRDLQVRYGKSPQAREMLSRMERGILAVEERLFRRISITPESLEDFKHEGS